MGAAKRFIRNEGNNAICYYRYSSDAQREESIESQRKEAVKYAKAKGLHIIKEYEDHAISGTRDDRPQFQQMLHEVGKLKPAYLILWKTDRLSRDKIDAVIAKKILRDNGVQLAYVAEAIPDDDEATQIIMESLYEAMAQSFIIGHRKNVMRGLNLNAEKAVYNGTVIIGYEGKQNSRYEIDEKTAPIVKKIFKDYADGMPLQKLCNELNDTGLKNKRGKAFTINSLRHILQNRAYVGEYRWGEHVIPDGMPRLIDDELFEKAQKRLEENKRGGKKTIRKLQSEPAIEDYWLTNHVYCEKCQGTMQGVSGTGKSGKLFYYYSCKNHRKHNCSMKNQKKELVEGMVMYLLDELLQDRALRIIIAQRCYDYYLEQNNDGGAYEASLKAELRETQKKLDNYLKAIENGIFNSSVQQRMEELEERKSQLKDQLIAEQNRKQYDIKLDTIVRFFDTFFGNINTNEDRLRILELLVDKILIGPDGLTVTMHYTDEKRILPFKETKESMENMDRLVSMTESLTLNETEETDTALLSLIGDGTDDDSGKEEEERDPCFFQ